MASSGLSGVELCLCVPPWSDHKLEEVKGLIPYSFSLSLGNIHPTGSFPNMPRGDVSTHAAQHEGRNVDDERKLNRPKVKEDLINIHTHIPQASARSNKAHTLIKQINPTFLQTNVFCLIFFVYGADCAK